jgi:hypothetical protein
MPELKKDYTPEAWDAYLAKKRSQRRARRRLAEYLANPPVKQIQEILGVKDVQI